MRLVIATLILCSGCGGDDGGDTNQNGAGPGVRDDSGWTEFFSFKVSGPRGLEGTRSATPYAIHADGSDLQLVYSEDVLGQQGETREGFGKRLPADGGAVTDFDPGLFPPNDNTVVAAHRTLWDGATPIDYFALENAGGGFYSPSFHKAGVNYYPPEDSGAPSVRIAAIGGAKIGADGKHYIFGSLPYAFHYQPPVSTWDLLYCYPQIGDPDITIVPIQDLVLDDPDLPVFVALGGSVTDAIFVWRTDPSLPHDASDNPGCGPVTSVTLPGLATKLDLLTIGGAYKVVASGETHVSVYALDDLAMTLEADVEINPTPSVSVATDGESLWIGYADSTRQYRATVMVQHGSTFDVVGEPAFYRDPQYAELPNFYATAPMLAAIDGRVFVAFSRPGYPDLDDGFGTMWIATPSP